MNNKHLAMYRYIAQYPGARRLFFNAGVAENDNIGLEPIFSDAVVKQYVDGSAIRCYDFAMVVFKDEKDLPNSTENAEDLFDVQQFMEWIDTQDKNGNYPDFGDDCTILRIRNLQNMPNTAGRDGRHAKYMFQCSVEYFEKV